MKEYTCLIVDDEPYSRELIKSYVVQTPFLQLAGMAKSALEIPEMLQQTPVDLVLLDIEMPKLNGLQFLQSWKIKPRVIFVTAHREYAVQAFDLEVVDYLLKPVSYERFVKAIHRFMAADEEKDRPDHIFILVEREMRKVLFEEIKYIEAMGDYLKFYTLSQDRPLMVKMTLGLAMEKLPASIFFQIHRSFVVNQKHITAYTAERIKIQDNWLTIGRHYKDELKKKLK